jgi:hypothetical protein
MSSKEPLGRETKENDFDTEILAGKGSRLAKFFTLYRFI